MREEAGACSRRAQMCLQLDVPVLSLDEQVSVTCSKSTEHVVKRAVSLLGPYWRKRGKGYNMQEGLLFSKSARDRSGTYTDAS